MALVKATIAAKARILLNEITQGFYLDTDINTWIDDAALDISVKSYCYHVREEITLVAGTQRYTPSSAVNALKVISAAYNGVGLTLATHAMQGKQVASVSGPPKHYFEILDQIGFIPTPGSGDVSVKPEVIFACATIDINNLPLKFQSPAVFFTVGMGLIKAKNYDKATLMFNIYNSSLGLDRVDVTTPKTEMPPPQNQYVLKIIPAQNMQG